MNAWSFLIAAVGFATAGALLIGVIVVVWDNVICGPDPVWEREDQWK